MEFDAVPFAITYMFRNSHFDDVKGYRFLRTNKLSDLFLIHAIFVSLGKLLTSLSLSFPKI